MASGNFILDSRSLLVFTYEELAPVLPDLSCWWKAMFSFLPSELPRLSLDALEEVEGNAFHRQHRRRRRRHQHLPHHFHHVRRV